MKLAIIYLVGGILLSISTAIMAWHLALFFEQLMLANRVDIIALPLLWAIVLGTISFASLGFGIAGAVYEIIKVKGKKNA